MQRWRMRFYQKAKTIPFACQLFGCVACSVYHVKKRKAIVFQKKETTGRIISSCSHTVFTSLSPNCRITLPQMSRSQGLFCEDKFLLYKINSGANPTGKLQVFLLKNSIKSSMTCRVRSRAPSVPVWLSICQK